jgi:hypothetical protein
MNMTGTAAHASKPRRPSHPLIFVGLMTVCGAAPGISFAQSDAERIRALERKLEQSLKTIEDLGARLNELETRTPPSQDVGPAPAAEQHEHGRRISDPGVAAPQAPTLLRGFADVGANFSGNRGNKGFFDGSLDFYLTPQLSSNVKSVIELVFEHDKTTGVLAADLERLQVGYAFSNVATVWLGRLHTPLGYWNTAFHHGQQLQTSVLRPQMIDFEDSGGVIPAHTVGVWGAGAVHAGNGRLSYDIFGGNSPSIIANVLDPNNSGKTQPGYSAGFNLGYLFGGSADGLKTGIHGYRAVVRDDSPVANVTRVNILGGYAALDSPAWELIAEYYAFRNQNLSGSTGRRGSWAGFVQLGPRVERWTPYVRLEKAALNQADNYFAALVSGRAYSRQALGLRYDLTSNSALKAELNHTVAEAAPTVSFNQLLTQWAMRF